MSSLMDNQVDTMMWDPVWINPRGPYFSHLCFAGVLTLIGKANQKTGNCIKHCLNLFMEETGLSINYAKSRLVFSKKYLRDITTHFANLFNMKSSVEFGKYLGFPILNFKPKLKDFQFVIDKMRSKLSLWKTNLLNIVGRTTLASTTLNAIPSHIMQYTMLPTKVLIQIDKNTKRFHMGYH